MSRDLLRTTFGAFNAIDFLYNNLSYSRSILYNEAQLHNHNAADVEQRSSPFLPNITRSRTPSPTRSLRIEGHSLPPLSSPIFDAGFDFEREYFGGESTLVDQPSPSVSSLESDDPVLRASERTDDSEAATSTPSTPNSPSGMHDENIDVALDSLSENVLSVSPVAQAIIGRPTMSSFGDSVPRSGSVLPSSNSEGCILGKRTRTQADLDDTEAVINGGNSTAVNGSIAISKAHFTDKHMPMSMLSIGTRDGVNDTSEGNASDAHDNLGQSSSLVAPASPHRCVSLSTGDANASITSCLASTSPTLVAHGAGTFSVSGPVQPAPALPIRGNTGNQITTEAELRPSDTVFACLFEDCRFEGTSQQVLQHCIDDHSYASGACPISTCTSTFSATREWKRHVESVHWRLRDNFVECKRCGVWFRRDDKRHIRSCRAMKGSKQMGNTAKRGPRRGASAAKDGKATTEEGARATGAGDASNIEDESSSEFILPKCEPTAKSGETLIQQEGISAQSRATGPIERSMEQVATTIQRGGTGGDDIRDDRLASGHRMTTRAAKRQCLGLAANDD